jgi:hypothetical protein
MARIRKQLCEDYCIHEENTPYGYSLHRSNGNPEMRSYHEFLLYADLQ